MKYVVMHYSNNWMYDGLATKCFNTLKEARHYVDFFRGSKAHKNDHVRIVRLIEEHNAMEFEEGVYGFKL